MLFDIMAISFQGNSQADKFRKLEFWAGRNPFTPTQSICPCSGAELFVRRNVYASLRQLWNCFSLEMFANFQKLKSVKIIS